MSLKLHIDQCLKEIEILFNRGNSDDWSTKDFSELASEIHKKTGVLLSVSTLKRIWGRVQYSSNPNRSTLDTLSQYLGYTGWIDYTHSTPEKKQRELHPFFQKGYFIIILSVLVVGIGYIFFPDNKSIPLKTDFLFTTKTVSDGIPNSVVFKYDATEAPENSVIEIQQNWDKTKRTKVRKEDSIATSIYYRPGYFKAKLVINDSIIKEEDLYIQNKGWLGVIEGNPSPVYLQNEDIKSENGIAISEEILSLYGVNAQIDKKWVSFYRVHTFGDLYIDDFEMITSVKSLSTTGVSICQNTRIAILYEGGAIVIPLSKKGCTSELSVRAYDTIFGGKTQDLSGFGVDFTTFINVRCYTKNKQLVFAVDEKEVFKIDLPDIHKKIVGIVYNFEGTGAVQELIFKTQGKEQYREDFEF